MRFVFFPRRRLDRAVGDGVIINDFPWGRADDNNSEDDESVGPAAAGALSSAPISSNPLVFKPAAGAVIGPSAVVAVGVSVCVAAVRLTR